MMDKPTLRMGPVKALVINRYQTVDVPLQISEDTRDAKRYRKKREQDFQELCRKEQFEASERQREVFNAAYDLAIDEVKL